MQVGSTIGLWNPTHKRFIRMPNGHHLDKSGMRHDGSLPGNWAWEKFKIQCVANCKSGGTGTEEKKQSKKAKAGKSLVAELERAARKQLKTWFRHPGPSNAADLAWCKNNNNIGVTRATHGGYTNGASGYRAERYGVQIIRSASGGICHLCAKWVASCLDKGQSTVNGITASITTCGTARVIIGCKTTDVGFYNEWHAKRNGKFCEQTPWELPLA